MPTIAQFCRHMVERAGCGRHSTACFTAMTVDGHGWSGSLLVKDEATLTEAVERLGGLTG